MPLLLLISLLIACMPIEWPKPPHDLGVKGSAILSASVVFALLLVARAFSLLTVYRLAAGVDLEAVSRADGRRRGLFYYLVIGAFWFIILRCGWGWASRELVTTHQYLTINDEPTQTDIGTPAPGAELLVLLPYLLIMVGAWLAFFDAELALHRSRPARPGRREFWTRWAYVGYSLRKQTLIVFLPIILWVFQLGLLRAFPSMTTDPWAKAGLFVAVILFFLLVPLLLPPLLGLKPLEPGPLRARLEAAAQRIGVRYRQLYVWDTRGQIATAMVAGLIAPVRQIVFTDLLLATLSDEEVEAVFGHEVGHVRHGHLFYYVAFLMLSILALGTVLRAAAPLIEASQINPHTVEVLSLVAAFAYLFVVFGFISRRCERQADVFGCKVVSCADPACVGHIPDTMIVPRGRALCPTGIGTFVKALERVEEINDSTRTTDDGHRPGRVGRVTGLLRFVGVWLGAWQHGTIAKRCEFLRTLDAAGERRFQRRVALIRWGLLLALVAGIATLAARVGWEAFADGM